MTAPLHLAHTAPRAEATRFSRLQDTADSMAQVFQTARRLQRDAGYLEDAPQQLARHALGAGVRANVTSYLSLFLMIIHMRERAGAYRRGRRRERARQIASYPQARAQARAGATDCELPNNSPEANTHVTQRLTRS